MDTLLSICLKEPDAALRGFENLFLSSKELLRDIKFFLEIKTSPRISIFSDLQNFKVLGISSIPNILSVMSSPVVPSPLVNALINFLFSYVSESETPSILQSTIKL